MELKWLRERGNTDRKMSFNRTFMELKSGFVDGIDDLRGVLIVPLWN